MSNTINDFFQSIDWNLKENGNSHYTSQYPGTELVVRRGQDFGIFLTFKRMPPFRSCITFAVKTELSYDPQARFQEEFGTSDKRSSDSWRAVQTFPGYRTCSISISSPVKAVIGRYTLRIKLTNTEAWLDIGTFVLLFNPWKLGEDVFLPDNKEREEYVLSESGVIFRGDVQQGISSYGWNYGQFQDGILNICLLVLDWSYYQNSTLDLNGRNDPIHIARVVSARINSNDDDKGIIEGKWRGDYSGGENPDSWTGSVAILKQWKDSGFQPVKYGQCWVFAGVVTTVLRCLGIPTRPITNFESAHDTDGNLIVDEYVDSYGNPRSGSHDSIWNYHVWNESWFVRGDLGSTYDGWQALDATPQERSGGIMRCGPASLTAIKEGDVDLNYDTQFIFAEVNADIVKWLDDGRKKKLEPPDTSKVGQSISTKAVGSDDRQDVTNNYKYPEGSPKEREVFEKASRKKNLVGLQPRRLVAVEIPSISGRFKVESPLKFGQDVVLVLILKNLASEFKQLGINMAACSIFYTRKPFREIWKSSVLQTLLPYEEKTFPIKISYAMYRQHLTSDNMIHVRALCNIADGNPVLVERVIILDNPSVTIKVLGQAMVGQEVKVEVMFTNPLEEELKGCVLQVEGSGLVVDTIKIKRPPVKAKESTRILLDIIPSKSGAKQLLVNFSCDKLQYIKGFVTIMVLSAPEPSWYYM